MYGSSNSASATANNDIGDDLIDGLGTINPAALNNDVNHSNNVVSVLPSPSLTATTNNTNPRGVKRSRSPEHPDDAQTDGHDGVSDDHGRRKRGRPPKIHRPTASESSTSGVVPANIQTPRMQSQPFPPQSIVSPPLTSPPEKTTPTKTLIKALPTVRDHTTDQLNEGGDEYIPKEFDEAGEKKVDAMGYLQGGREYKCRTFRVPLRGDKLFMLATECARVLGYRDSYLLFNKNRSLHKIIASQIEKDDLIQQDILPYSYRSRQIAIVTARSMFRQFGSRVIVNGRRVRDDYWESKARKQGFTEEDLAGEKRPGAAKARDAAAAAEAANASLLPTLAHGDVIYSNDSLEAMPNLPLGAASSMSLSSLALNNLATTTDDPRLKEYTSLPRSRHEMTGQPYQDRSQPSSAAEIMNQASHTADFNKILSSQRSLRQKGLEDFYMRQREASASAASSEEQQRQLQSQQSQPPPTAIVQQRQSQHFDSSVSTAQPLQSQVVSAGMVNSENMIPQQPSMMTSQGSFSQPGLPQVASPIRGMPAGMRPDLMQRSALSTGTPQTPPYGYPPQPQQLWGQPPPQPQPSAPQGVGMSPYAAQIHAPPQQGPSLVHQSQQPHPSQSPRNQPRTAIPPHLQQSFPLPHQVSQQQQMASMGFPATATAYPAMVANRAMYPSAQASGGQPFIAGNTPQSGLAGIAGMNAGGIPGWPSNPGAPMQPGNPAQGQSGSPLGGWSGY